MCVSIHMQITESGLAVYSIFSGTFYIFLAINLYNSESLSAEVLQELEDHNEMR